MFLIVVGLLFAVYTLLPTVLNLKEKRAAALKAGEELPWYVNILPEEQLNLGLDLQGGLYLELNVDLEEAVSRQVALKATDIERYVLNDNFKNSKATALKNNVIRVFMPEANRDKFQTEVVRVYGNNSFNMSVLQPELLYRVAGPAGSLVKQVSDHLQSQKLSAVNIEIIQGNLLAVLASQDNRLAIKNAVASSDVASRLTFVEAVPEIMYMEFSEAELAKVSKNIIDQAANSVRNRIDRFGVAESSVSRQSDDRLVVELPGIKDPNEIIDIIKRTGQLEFRIVNTQLSTAELQSLIEDQKTALKIEKPYEKENLSKINEALKGTLPQNTSIAFSLVRSADNKKVIQSTPYLLENDVPVTGDMLDNAAVQVQRNMPYVSMTFNKTGAKQFGDLTQKNIGRQLAIVLDGTVTTAPNIKSAILNGQAQIELGFGRYESLMKEAQEIVLVLKEGALPASLSVATKNIIGPSLGKESIEAGLNSLMIAAMAVIFFMLVYYKVGGIVSNLALIFNVTFLFAILTLFQASLTLPGIAGIVLTLGMAVDANVIIFERMREELYLGRSASSVVESGYGNAMSAIIDGNITTFISGLVLFQFGTGPIKGFATTLMIGIMTTLITAVVFTRVVYDWMIGSLNVKKIRV